MGWYAGAGARRISRPSRAPALARRRRRRRCHGEVDCDWVDRTGSRPSTHSIRQIGRARVVAKLTGASGKQRYIVFVVRDDTRQSDFLFSAREQVQAYNNWGGKSIYDFNSSGGRASRVSFNRPYASGLQRPHRRRRRVPAALGIKHRCGPRAGRLRRHLREDVDVHHDGAPLLQHRGVLIVGHNEYWSWEMRSTHRRGARRGREPGLLRRQHASGSPLRDESDWPG